MITGLIITAQSVSQRHPCLLAERQLWRDAEERSVGSSRQCVFFKSQEMGSPSPNQEIRLFCTDHLFSRGIGVGWRTDANLLQYLAVCELCAGRSDLIFFFQIIIFFSLNQNSAQYPVLNKYFLDQWKRFSIYWLYPIPAEIESFKIYLVRFS